MLSSLIRGTADDGQTSCQRSMLCQPDKTNVNCPFCHADAVEKCVRLSAAFFRKQRPNALLFPLRQFLVAPGHDLSASRQCLLKVLAIFAGLSP